MKKIGFFVVIILVAVFALRTALFVPGIIGHTWDWGVPNFPEQFRIQAKASFSIWDDRLYGGFFFPTKVELPYWLLTSFFSFLGGDVLSKMIPLLILIIAGISALFAFRKIFSLDYFWALMAGMVYMLSPFAYSRLMGGHLTILLGYAFLPLILYFSVALFDLSIQDKFSKAGWLKLIFLIFILSLGVLHPLVLMISWGIVFFTAFIFFILRKGRRRKVLTRFFLILVFWALLNAYWLLLIVLQLFGAWGELAVRPWETVGEEMVFRLPYFSTVSRPLSELFSFSFPFGLHTEFVYPVTSFFKSFFALASILLFITSITAFYLVFKKRKRYLPVVIILTVIEIFGFAMVAGDKTIVGDLLFSVLIQIVPFIFSVFSNPLRFLPLVILPLAVLPFVTLAIIEEKSHRLVGLTLRGSTILALLVFFYPWFFHNLTTPVITDSEQPMSLMVTKVNPEDKKVFDYLKEFESDFRVTYLPPAFVSWPGETDLSYCWNTIYSSKPAFLEYNQPLLAKEIINNLYSQQSSSDLSKLLGLGTVKTIIYPHYQGFESYQGFIKGTYNYKPIFDRNWNEQRGIEKKTTDFTTVDVYENENFIPHIFVPEQATFIGDEKSLLPEIVTFPDYRLRNAIFSQEKEESKTTLALKMTDNIYVKPRFVSGYAGLPQIRGEELHPPVRLLPTSPLYAYVRFKERRLWQATKDYPIIRINTGLVLMSKRLNELKIMVELQGNTQEAEKKVVERYQDLLNDFSEQLNGLIERNEIDNDLLIKSWIFLDDHQKNFNYIIQKTKSAYVIMGIKEIFNKMGEFFPLIEENVWITKKEEEKKYLFTIPEEGDYFLFASPEIGNKLNFEIDEKSYTREGEKMDSDWISLGGVKLEKGSHRLKINLSEQPNLFSELATSSAIKRISPEEPGYSYQFFAQKENQVISAHLAELDDRAEYKISFKYQVVGNPLGLTLEQANDGEVRGMIRHKIDRFLPMEDRWMKFEDIITPNLGSHEADLNFYLMADENETDTYFIKDIEVRQLLSPKIIFKKENEIKESQIPKITYTKINPNRYTVKIEKATGPYFLVFSENFNEGWRAYIDKEQTNNKQQSEKIIASYFEGEIKEGEHKNTFLDKGIFSNVFKESLPEENHLLVNAFANTWYIDRPGNYQITLEFVPQRVYFLGLVISFISLVCLLGCFTVFLLRRRKK